MWCSRGWFDQIKVGCKAVLDSARKGILGSFAVIDSKASTVHFASMTPNGIAVSIDGTPVVGSSMD